MSEELRSTNDQLYIDAVEKYRANSRSIAGLTATAAAAVIAGLIFSPVSVHMAIDAAVFGIASFIFLMLALGAFVLSFMYHAPELEDDARSKETTAELAKRAKTGIERRAIIGMSLGAAALLMLGLLPVTHLLIQEQALVTLQLKQESAIEAICPNIRGSFKGTATLPLLRSNSTYEIHVDGRTCTGDENRPDLTLQLNAANVAAVSWKE